MLDWAEYAAREFEGPASDQTAARYLDDPVGFARECIDWPRGRRLFPYQADVIEHIVSHHRVAVRGPRGLGKTTLSALIVLWFAITRDAAGIDWKIGTTAGSFLQVSQFTWPEVHKWARLLNPDAIGRGRLNERTELLTLKIRLKFGEAFAASVDNPYLIEGAHADHVLFVFDESKAIASSVFDSVEGTFSNAGTEGREAYALSISTPGEPAGFFYDIHARRPGTGHWWARHVTKDEAIAAGAISADWCEQSRLRWGAGSALYHNHVLGEFYSADEDGVIPLSWAEAAIERWKAWDEAGRPDQGGPHIIGVDVARTGSDKTVIALRDAWVIHELRATSREDTMSTAGRVAGILNADPGASAVVDVIGVGAGVYDRLREQGHNVEAFNASAGTRRKDASGEFSFLNTRAAAHWNLRELLDPSRHPEVALPPDDELLGDLTAIHWRVSSGGKIQVESKDDIRKRIGRSPDRGDAVVEALWVGGVSWAEAYGLIECAGCGEMFAPETEGRPVSECRACGEPVAERHRKPEPKPEPGRAAEQRAGGAHNPWMDVYGARGAR